MTVTYTGEVATCTGLGCFWKLLFRWRGSIYKLLWPNLIVYSLLYFSLSGTYRFLLDSDQRTFFEKMSLHCQVYGDLIPVSFVLGFYVSIVIKRWWDQYLCLPWPDNLALFVSSLVHGQDERGRMMRRTIMRYVNLSLLLTLRMISPRVKKRFPTLDHVVEAGWMLSGEKKIFVDLEHKTPHTKYWMPLVWAGGIVTRARKENRIKDDFAVKTLIDELNIFRGGCGGMLNYDWISIPLVYTQVVTLAVYIFFLSTLMGNQYLDPSKGYPKHQIDLFLPVFTFLQFFFYMGWLKVAESLVNPFGEDDDDFELNWLLDRNLQISYVIVDEMHQEHPEMLKDQYWDEIFPTELPYTAAAKQYQTGRPQHSAEVVEVPSHQAEFMPLVVLEEKVEESASDSTEEIDIQIEHPSVQRGETHPMKIKQKYRTPGGVITYPSEQSSLSSKGRSSVLNLLSRIFNHKRSSKEEVNPLGSSASLRSRRGNRSTSRLSSVSHSRAPSRSSFVKESIPYHDFQLEVFAMSDLDIPNTGISAHDGTEPKISTTPTIDVSRTSLYENSGKLDGDKSTGDTYDTGTPKLYELGNRKELKVPLSSVPLNSDRKDISPNNFPPTDNFFNRNSAAKIIVQNNSPVYQVFTPLNTTAFVSSVRFPPSKDFCPKLDRDLILDSQLPKENIVKDKLFVNDIGLPESVITILPPAEIPRPEKFKMSAEILFDLNTGIDPTTSINCSGNASQINDTSSRSTYPSADLIPSPPKISSTETPIAKFAFVDSGSSKGENQSTFRANSGPENMSPVDRVPEPIPQINLMVEPPIQFTEELIQESTSEEKLEPEVTTPDPSTPSPAIPVPAMSQAHVTPSVDLELGRRPLEPIIEHKDEGTSSIGSSVLDFNTEESIPKDRKAVEVEGKPGA